MAQPSVRNQILAAGLEALHQRGFNATSVQDITAAAGVPKGSFYNHFASKDDLGVAVVEAYATKTGALLPILKDHTVKPLTRLRRYFESMIALHRFPGAPGCLLGNFAAELSNQSPAIRARIAAALEGWTAALAEPIAEAQRAGDLPHGDKPKALAAFVIDCWEGAVLRAKIEGKRAPLDSFLTFTFAKILA
jgi:TetR/AcrR family transcriptional regulator, transcriptional repressor for nem operon